jgi:FAD/FMN-containing dehydrogenase
LTGHRIPFLATSKGRHGYSPSFGKLKDGVAVDMSLFDAIKIDVEANVMTVGGGVIISDVLDALYQAGKEIRKSIVLRGISEARAKMPTTFAYYSNC